MVEFREARLARRQGRFLVAKGGRCFAGEFADDRRQRRRRCEVRLDCRQRAPQRLDQIAEIEALALRYALQQRQHQALAIELRAGIAHDVVQHQQPQQPVETPFVQRHQRGDAMHGPDIDQIGDDQGGVLGLQQMQQPQQRGLAEPIDQPGDQPGVVAMAADEVAQPVRMMLQKAKQAFIESPVGQVERGG